MDKRYTEQSSYRDPSGFVFYANDVAYRQVNKTYSDDYDFLMNSGLYDFLISKQWLIPHQEVNSPDPVSEQAYKILQPEQIPFISYPYEWSFNQIKDAALLNLRIQKSSLKRGMTLKDANGFNIQFLKGKPVLIDTLSFERYIDDQPWVAYGQFCRHFLAPLALMSYTHIELNQLLKIYPDGIPLELASKLLPYRTRWNISIYMHIHLHARLQKKYEQKLPAKKNATISKNRLIALVDNLINTVSKLNIQSTGTQWADYYNFTNYNDSSFTKKKEIVSSYLGQIKPAKLWDMGANTGIFTMLAAEMGAQCIAFDIDPLAIDAFYKMNIQNQEINILPLVMNLTNPSPAIGWDNSERLSVKNRPLPDTILALALIHHLCITYNLPLDRIAHYFSQLSENLIIEFVPKSDSQVQKLLQSRKDIFDNYNIDEFERVFTSYYTIEEKQIIPQTERTLYRMKRTGIKEEV